MFKAALMIVETVQRNPLVRHFRICEMKLKCHQFRVCPSLYIKFQLSLAIQLNKKGVKIIRRQTLAYSKDIRLVVLGANIMILR